MADGGHGGQNDLKADVDALGEALKAAAERENAMGPIAKAIRGFWDALKHPRHPKGGPNGGQFSGKDGPKAKVTVNDYGSLFGWKGDVTDPGAYASKPKPRPNGAVTHPGVDDNGDAVWIDYPSKPSPPEGWSKPGATLSFTPNSATPPVLNGTAMTPWTAAPKTDAEWLAVPGQNHDVEVGWPELTAPKGKRIGAGVIVEEPDGRFWIVAPTNAFGGYRNTFPKGTYEDGIASLQANAIKEAYEESGLQVEITDVLGDFERTTSTARMYMARRVGGTPNAMGWESQAVRLVPFDKLKSFLNRSEVDHPIVNALEEYLTERIRKSFETVAKAFDEGKIERWPKGSPLGGQFKSKGAGGVAEPPKIGWKKDGSGPGANAVYYNKMKAAYDAAAKGDLGPAKALWKANQPFAKQFGDGVKMNSHGKWKAQTAQYAFELLADAEEAKDIGLKASVVDAKLGAPAIAKWKKVGDKPGGTAPGGLYTDESGQKWLVKGNLQGKDDNRAKNEVLTSKLMAASGIPAPEYKLVDLGNEYGGGMGVAVKWEDGLSKVGLNPSGITKKKAYDQFAVHAWLGNWDVVGAEGDNLMRRPDGSMVNIDPGGALLYRAQGAPKKPGEFGSEPHDWNSMRKTGNSAAVVFGGMTTDDLQNSAMKLQGVTDAQIGALVDAHGPGDAKVKAELTKTLIARRDAILELNQLDPADTKAKADIALAVSAYKKQEAAKAEAEPEKKAAPIKLSSTLLEPLTDTPLIKAFGNEVPESAYAYVYVVGGEGAFKEPSKALVPKLQESLDSNLAYAKGTSSSMPDSTKLKGLKSAAGMAAIIGYHQTGKADLESIAEFEAEFAKTVFGSDEAYQKALEADLNSAPVKAPSPRAPKEPPAENPKPSPAVSALKKDAPLPGAPDWAAAKLADTNTNAPSHNKKVAAIQAAFEKGDADAIAGMKFGTNTYGKKQAALANNALAALGSDKAVAAGPMKGAKAADAVELGASAPPKNWPPLSKGEKVVESGSEFGMHWAKIEVPPKGFTPKDVQTPPDFFSNGTQGETGTWKSSKKHINEANNATVQEIYAAATKKGATPASVADMQVAVLNKETGQPTGKTIPVQQHPAQLVKDYHDDVVAELKAQVEPTYKTVQHGSMTGSYSAAARALATKTPKLGQAQIKDWAKKAADYCVISDDAAAKLPVPKEGQFKDWTAGSASFQKFNDASKAALEKDPSLKSLINSYTGSSYVDWNAKARKGLASGQSKSLLDKFDKAAQELPEGIILHRGVGIGANTFDSVVGAVIQDGSVNSASYGSKAAFSGHQTQLRLHIGKGVKALNVTSASKYGSMESEIVLAPNSRYAVMKVTHAGSQKTYVDILVLPH